MTHSDLKRQILDIIKDITGKEFVNPIIIKDLEPEGYNVGFEVVQHYPIWISAELPDDKFLKFIKKELQQAKWLKMHYARAVRNTTGYPSLSLSSPYDTRRINGKNG